MESEKKISKLHCINSEVFFISSLCPNLSSLEKMVFFSSFTLNIEVNNTLIHIICGVIQFSDIIVEVQNLHLRIVVALTLVPINCDSSSYGGLIISRSSQLVLIESGFSLVRSVKINDLLRSKIWSISIQSNFDHICPLADIGRRVFETFGPGNILSRDFPNRNSCNNTNHNCCCFHT